MTNIQPLTVGQSVKFDLPMTESRWWTVIAGDDRFTILVRKRPFTKDDYLYTIIDRVRECRGPCDLLGQGWGFSKETLREDAEELLQALQRYDTMEPGPVEHVSTQVSYRNNVPVSIKVVRNKE